MNFLISWVRAERPLTGSYITYRLPYPMDMEGAENWLKYQLPGWEVVSGAITNPDED